MSDADCTPGREPRRVAASSMLCQMVKETCQLCVTFILWISYLRQGGYVFVIVCVSVCLFVCLLATLRKN